MPNQNLNSTQMYAQLQESWTTKGVYSSVDSFAYGSVYIKSMRNSVNTPGYKRLKRPKGSSPMNPVIVENSTDFGTRGELITKEADYLGEPLYALQQRRYSGGISDLVNFPTDKPVLSQEEIDASDAICRNKLLLKLKDQKVNLMQAFAERHQTVDLVTKTAARIADCIVDLKRGNLALAADHLGVLVSNRAKARYRREWKKAQPKAVANGWLELQYGWKPLLNDVYGSCEVLAEAYYLNVPRTKVSAVNVITRDWIRKDKVLSNGRVPAVSHHHVKHITKYVVYFSEANKATHTLSSLGITNPALIAWELTPWSFVVDWFIPIGNWISTMDATLGLQFDKGTRSTLVVSTARRSVDVRNFGTPYLHYVLATARNNFEWVDYRRTPLTRFPSSALPAFKNPFGFEHVANAMALLTQLFKK